MDFNKNELRIFDNNYRHLKAGWNVTSLELPANNK